MDTPDTQANYPREGCSFWCGIACATVVVGLVLFVTFIATGMIADTRHQTANLYERSQEIPGQFWFQRLSSPAEHVQVLHQMEKKSNPHTAASVGLMLDDHFDGLLRTDRATAKRLTELIDRYQLAPAKRSSKWDRPRSHLATTLVGDVQEASGMDASEAIRMLEDIEDMAAERDEPPIQILRGMQEHADFFLSECAMYDGSECPVSLVVPLIAHRQTDDLATYRESVDCYANHNRSHPACIDVPECTTQHAAFMASAERLDAKRAMAIKRGHRPGTDSYDRWVVGATGAFEQASTAYERCTVR